MRVNIVTERGDWILNRCARELADRIPGVTVNGPEAGWTYYMPAYSWCKPDQIGPRAIGLWTHPTKERFDAYCGKFVANVAMNRTVGLELADRGCPVVVIRPGSSVARKPIRFGVCGRTYPSGRKGEHLVREMVKAGFDVIGHGPGWPCPPSHAPCAEDFYDSIDYLVVTSTEEGGPVPVIEAISRGVPVIAPDVGWCWEFPVIRYERGSWDSLRSVLRGLTDPPTWERWAEDHAALFARIQQEAA